MVCKTCTTRFDYKKKANDETIWGDERTKHRMCDTQCVENHLFETYLLLYRFFIQKFSRKKNQLDFTTQADISNV